MPPFCVDCKHHDLTPWGSHVCERNNVKTLNLITGVEEYDNCFSMCETERNLPVKASPLFLCGEEGIYFEPKEKHATS